MLRRELLFNPGWRVLLLLLLRQWRLLLEHLLDCRRLRPER